MCATREHYYMYIAVFSLTIIGSNAQPGDRIAYACYGTTDNFLELTCNPGNIIKVTTVLYGSKLKADNCPVPTVNNQHDPSCCYKTDTDCAFSLPGGVQTDPYMKLCAGLEVCSMRTLWLDTAGHCTDQHMANTNFMQIVYICLKGNSTRPNHPPPYVKTTKTTTTATTTTEQLTTKYMISQSSETENSQTSSKTKTTTKSKHSNDADSTTTLPTVPKVTPGQHIKISISLTTPLHTTLSPQEESSSFAFTTGMMGGMTAAIIGLMITIFGFLFYWGRRRQKTVAVKPNSPKDNSTVWDFLLAHTVAARTFRRGYDNFSNNQEAASNESGPSSPAKPTWQPNIRVEANLDTQSVTSDENCSIVNINTLGSVSSRTTRSEV